MLLYMNWKNDTINQTSRKNQHDQSTNTVPPVTAIVFILIRTIRWSLSTEISICIKLKSIIDLDRSTVYVLIDCIVTRLL